jgi:phage tail sheath gpL-like
MHAADGFEYSGAELQLTARKFFEADSCSSDSSRCILFYAKKGACLRIDTIGEKLNDMMVTRWADECPGAPPKPSREPGRANGRTGQGVA